MEDRFERERRIFGDEGMKRLAESRVIVFGVGGVGGHCIEALARSGIGTIAIVDADRVALSNLNRQIIALESTVGELKTDVAEKRIKDINPECNVIKYPMFYLPENADDIDLSQFDYVIDCIDTILAKIELVIRCRTINKPLISSMGTGNKVDPSKLQLADISKTSVCPLARVMRQELRKRGIYHLRCVFSTEEPVKSRNEFPEGERSPGSTAVVPATAGLLIASEVVRTLANM